jgi:hypothetical protein
MKVGVLDKQNIGVQANSFDQYLTLVILDMAIICPLLKYMS